MKRLLPILLFILLFATQSQGQTHAVLPDASIVRFYPNPAVTSITFDLDKIYDKGYTLEVYSFLGKRMYQVSNLGQHTTINLSDFNRGVYIYQLRDKSGRMIESGKFQVSK